MLKKVTVGFVIQTFDPKTKKFVSQEFICGDDVSYEDEDGNVVDEDEFKGEDGKEDYLPFDMVPPQ